MTFQIQECRFQNHRCRVQMTEWGERFDALVERKTADAREAAIAPLVTDRDETGDRLAGIGNAWSRAMFGGLFYVSPSASGVLPATSLVFVQSRDGNTVTPDPASLGGGEADKHLIYEGLSRVAADAVLAGARSIGAARDLDGQLRRHAGDRGREPGGGGV